MTSRIPRAYNMGREVSSVIYEIYMNYTGNGCLPKVNVPNACNYPLPEFQRPFVWTQEQQTRFIESLWRGISPGFYVYNDIKCIPGMSLDTYSGFNKYSGLLLDGQQRITTLQRYWDNKFPVFGLYWNDLTRDETMQFKMTRFTSYITNIWDESELKEYYNILNFGGTAHEVHQIAK